MIFHRETRQGTGIVGLSILEQSIFTLQLLLVKSKPYVGWRLEIATLMAEVHAKPI